MRSSMSGVRIGTGTSRGSRRGYVLIVSMGILGLLAMLGTTFVVMARSEEQVSMAYVDQVRARMIAFSGLEHAVGALSRMDRVHPWSGHFWFGGAAPAVQTSVGTIGVQAIGDGLLPLGDPAGGVIDDDWFYGELFKRPVTAPPGAGERRYGQPIPQPGRMILNSTILPALHPSLPSMNPVTKLPNVATNAAGQPFGYSSNRDLIRGTYVNEPDNPGDYYILKIVDAAGRIYVNDTNSAGRLTRMLNTLGTELDPDLTAPATLGTIFAALRGANNAQGFPNDPIDDESEFKTRLRASYPALTQADAEAVMDRIRDFVTFHAWVDMNVLRVPFLNAGVSAATPVEGRAPINLNTAPREVMVALFNGLAGQYYQRSTAGITTIPLTITLVEAQALADHFINCRYYYGGGEPRSATRTWTGCTSSRTRSTPPPGCRSKRRT